MRNILEGIMVGSSVLRHPLETNGQRNVSGKPRRGGELPEPRYSSESRWAGDKGLRLPDSVSSSVELSSGGGWKD